CDNCGAAYNPQDLKNPGCALCGTTPVIRSADHIFFRLENFRNYLKEWLPQHCSAEVTAKMLEWFSGQLRDWDISRDAPYFGFEIPGEKNKFFYVWVDAPMGYVSTTEQWCEKNNKNFADYWLHSDRSEVYHFIGKDITYFHTLFWPALLKSAGFRSPTSVFVHGRLMINGEKMSKSKGTMIPVRTYLNHLAPEYFRYYLAAKLGPGLDDLDWNMEDFSHRVNSELIGKITNLGSRGATMLNKRFSSTLSQPDSEGQQLIDLALSRTEQLAAHYEAREFSKVITELRSIADEANRYFDTAAPWKIADSQPDKTQSVLTTTLAVFRWLAICLQPVLPEYSRKVSSLFREEKTYSWSDAHNLLPRGHRISEYQHLLIRVESDKLKMILQESERINKELDRQRKAASTATNSSNSNTSKKRNEPVETTIDIETFLKIDLRVAKILGAEEIEGADKLLRLKVDLGGETRQIIAGIRAAYRPQDLIGRLTVVVANLAPRKMKFGVSEGMLLAAGEGGSDLYLLSPDSGAKAGQRIK
ncbi:MAG: methionine--tRNA ligase, partial [Bdellovibrionaceae bacterium]|nr:methionine--tRNA ligase [Pseudobdellovibrionaceae bacterium]